MKTYNKNMTYDFSDNKQWPENKKIQKPKYASMFIITKEEKARLQECILHS